MQARLGRTIRKGLEAGNAQPVHGSNVDYPRGVGGRGGGFEERRHGLGDGEDAREVQGQHARPC